MMMYAMLAYILYSNDIIDDEDFVLSNENFLEVEMPNAEVLSLMIGR